MRPGRESLFSDSESGPITAMRLHRWLRQRWRPDIKIPIAPASPPPIARIGIIDVCIAAPTLRHCFREGQ